MGEVILAMKDIDKSFIGVHALKNACLGLRKSEVHAPMGENDAGKSTLMKILTGIYSKDSDTIVYEERQMEFRGPKEAQDTGIVVVHQELSMMNRLMAARNIFIGKEKMDGKLINDHRMVGEAEKLFGLLNIRIDPRGTVGGLTTGRQQMCEIARTIPTDAKIIVFDEPTTALTDLEISELFEIIRGPKTKDIGIICISYRMNEINQITDRVTVMRDGEYVDTLITRDSTKDDIIQVMVGRTVCKEPRSFSNIKPSAPAVLGVERLNVGKTIKDVSFELRKGEILGFSRLMGTGKTETIRAIFDVGGRDNGDICVNEERVDIKSPQDAVSAEIGYLSEGHKHYGVIIEKMVTGNTTMTSLKAFCKSLFIDKDAERETAEQYVEALRTKTPSMEQQVHNLSGGNQQRVVIVEWLTRSCDILIFDGPTRRIDMGAKSEIYTLMNNLVRQGKPIIIISSELTEMLRMSDHILITCEGRKTGEVSIEEATQEEIMHATTLGD